MIERRVVAVNDGVTDAILDHAAAAAPHECCGTMLGWLAGPGAPARVVAVLPSRNIAGEEPERRFVIDPGDIRRAAAWGREQGYELVGFFHSHPVGEAAPSVRDVADCAHWPGHVHAIAGRRDGAWRDVRCFLTAQDRWFELQKM